MPVPTTTPVALSAEFIEEPTKRQQWTAFLRRSGIAGDIALADVINLVGRFLVPPSAAAAAREPFQLKWPPSGDWL